MKVIIRVRLPHVFGSRQKVAPSVAAPVLGPTRTFSATLRDCLDDWEITQEAPQRPAQGVQPIAPAITRSADEKKPSLAHRSTPAAKAAPSPLTRAWSWAQTKYKLTATKRVRVSETVQLGEKRFVAVVCVEGREFLIGGGSSGVSLLAQLDPLKAPRNEQHAGYSCIGDSA